MSRQGVEVPRVYSFHDPFLSPYFSRSRPEVLNLVPRDARKVLDVGCGSGRLGKDLKKRQNVIVHGIEMSEPAAQRAARYMDKVWISPVESVLDELEPDTYDCIVLADVLEHLRDPWMVLKGLATKVMPGGVVIASIPNVQNQEVILNLLAGRWNYTSEGLLDKTHLRFFSRQTVRELFWASGLRVERMETVQDRTIERVILGNMPKRKTFSGNGVRDFSVWQFLVTGRRCEPEPSTVKAGLVVHRAGREQFSKFMKANEKNLFQNSELMWAAVARSGLPSAEALCRLGCDPSRVDFVVVLDGRTVVSSDFMGSIKAQSRLDPITGLFVPGIYRDSDYKRLVGIGFRWNYSSVKFDRVGSEDGFSLWPDPVCVDSALPIGMVAQGEAFAHVGGFDSRLCGTWRVHDFCCRLACSGYLCAYVPGAKV